MSESSETPAPTLMEIKNQIDRDLVEAQAQLRAAQGRVAELEGVRTGLRIAVDRYGLGMETMPS